MNALLMCGGRGTRLDADVEKPLFRVGGRPMIDRVADALAASRVETTYAVVSPNAPATDEHVAARLATVETPGDGYVADLTAALEDERVRPPVLTVAADLPLLDGDAVDTVVDRYDRVATRSGREGEDGVGDGNGEGEGGEGGGVDGGGSGERRAHVSRQPVDPPGLAVHVPADAKRSLGVSVDAAADGPVPAGINVVTGAERDRRYVTDDTRLAVNVNRRTDAEVAEGFL